MAAQYVYMSVQAYMTVWDKCQRESMNKLLEKRMRCHLVLETEEREATCPGKHQLSHGRDTSERVLNNQCHDAAHVYVCVREKCMQAYIQVSTQEH